MNRYIGTAVYRYVLIAAACVSTPAGFVNAAQVPIELTSIDARIIDVSVTTETIVDNATWTYDTVTGVVTATGNLSLQIDLSGFPATFNTYFTHEITDLSIGGGLVANGTAFNCINGNFAAFFSGTSCGNYGWGANGLEESIFSYGPGLAFNRTIGGDDLIIAPQHTIALYDLMDSNLAGDTLTLSNIGLVPPEESQYNPDFIFTFTLLEQPVADALFSVSASADELGIVDAAAGTIELVGILDSGTGNFATPVSLAARPSDGELFVWNNSSSNLPPSTPAALLITVNRCTGAAGPVDGSTPLSDLLIGGLAFDDADGTLYATGAFAGSMVNSLFVIDDATGVATSVADLSPNVRIAGLDFGPDGQLYAAELSTTGTQRLFTIDTSNGLLTEVATLSQDVGVIGTIVFDPAGQIISSSVSAGGFLFDLDPATGTVSNIRNLPLVPVPGGTLSALAPQGMDFSSACDVDDSVLGFFEAAVEDGTLVGNGNGNNAERRLGLMRELLEEADAAAEAGMLTEACAAYEEASDNVDGDQSPPDYVTGPAAPELSLEISSERFTLGCIQISG